MLSKRTLISVSCAILLCQPLVLRIFAPSEKALMNLSDKLTKAVKDAVQELFSATLESVEIQPTRKDFEGDLTVVVFPILRVAKGNPAVIGEQIGTYVKENLDEIADFNVVKGFLNLVISN